MLTRLGRAANSLAARSPFTDVMGFARTLLALATLGTLVASDPATLFHPAADGGAGPRCVGTSRLALWCVVGPDRLQLARWLAIAALLVVASGWRPRWTALPHWWLTWSLSATVTLTDGGDQVAAVLTFLLVPLALADRRRSHWAAPADLPDTVAGATAEARRRVLGHAVGWVIRLQVAGIYLHAAIAKLGQAEWADGTALYYWLGNPVFGLPPWLRPLSEPVLAGPSVAFVTWGVLVLELLLGAALLATPAWRRRLLVVGVGFHLGIALMGLASFALTMCAALLLCLRPADAPLDIAFRVRRSLATLPRMSSFNLVVRRRGPAPRDGA